MWPFCVGHVYPHDHSRTVGACKYCVYHWIMGLRVPAQKKYPSILCLTSRTTVTSALIPEEDPCHRALTCGFFSRIQKGTPGLTHKRCVLQRVSLGALSDVTVVLWMRQSIAWNFFSVSHDPHHTLWVIAFGRGLHAKLVIVCSTPDATRYLQRAICYKLSFVDLRNCSLDCTIEQQHFIIQPCMHEAILKKLTWPVDGLLKEMPSLGRKNLIMNPWTCGSKAKPLLSYITQALKYTCPRAMLHWGFPCPTVLVLLNFV